MKRPFGKSKDVEAPPEADRLAGASHPRATEHLYGHFAAERSVLAMWQVGKLPSALLIGGREGIGKATLAWRLARFLAVHPSPQPGQPAPETLAVDMRDRAVQRILAGSNGDISVLRREWNEKDKKHYTEIRVDDVRAALHVFQRSAAEGGYRICIIDCAEELNLAGANALLKMIEEPPARALFLIVSHRPAALLPTIRSRCRRLALTPLAEPEIVTALRGQGGEVANLPAATQSEAARRAGGSMRLAMRRLLAGAEGAGSDVERLLDRLPRLDWGAVHRLADAVAPRAATERFEAFLDTTLDWLHERVEAGAGSGVARLAPYAEVWEKLRHTARQTEAYNIDRKPLILRTFAELAEAARRAG